MSVPHLHCPETHVSGLVQDIDVPHMHVAAEPVPSHVSSPEHAMPVPHMHAAPSHVLAFVLVAHPPTIAPHLHFEVPVSQTSGGTHCGSHEFPSCE